MRALIVGASGLVGGALLRVLGPTAVGTFRTRPGHGLIRLDASDESAFAEVLRRYRPEVIYLPAAEPNVDWCELHPEEARELNLGPIRSALRVAAGARLVGYSSDYVFDGSAGPYTEESDPRPLSVYGRVKRELEELLLGAGHTVIRTASVFGLEQVPPKNFVLRLASALRRGETVPVPRDQWSTPTFADDLGSASIRIATGLAGIWHLAGVDLMPRHEFAYQIAEVFGLAKDLVRPVPTTDLAQVARRPSRAGLKCDRFVQAFGAPARPTIEALRIFRAQVEAADRRESSRGRSASESGDDAGRTL